MNGWPSASMKSRPVCSLTKQYALIVFYLFGCVEAIRSRHLLILLLNDAKFILEGHEFIVKYMCV